MHFLGTIVRFIVSAIVYLLVSYIVPGFSIANFGTAVLAAIVVALIGWVLEALFGEHVTRFHRGIIGFVVSALVLYVAQWVVPGMRVTLLGAVIASLVIALVDLFLPVQRPGPAARR